MKLDLNALILDLEGKCLDGPSPGDPPANAKTILVQALMAQFADEGNLDGTEKFKRFELAMRIHKGGEQDFTAEEIVLLKKLLGKAYGTLIVGRMYQMLEGVSVKH